MCGVRQVSGERTSISGEGTRGDKWGTLEGYVRDKWRLGGEIEGREMDN